MNRVVILLYIVFCFRPIYAQQFDFSEVAARERMKTDVEILASDSLEGRESGEAGAWKAAHYIASQFKEAGISPHPALGSYFQPFRFSIKYDVLPDGKEGQKVLIKDGDTLKIGTEIHVSPLSSNDTLHRKTVFIDDSIVVRLFSEPEYRYNLNEKVAMINLSFHKNTGLTDSLPADDLLYQIIHRLKNTGASAVLLLGDGGSLYELFSKLHSPVGIPVIYVRKHISPTVKRHWENQMVDITLGAERIIDTAYNVIGYIDNKAKRTVVIGAHYDHLGMGEFGSHCKEKDLPAMHKGADDNASGTAMILELARYIKNHDIKNHNYLIVAFDAEERGLYGSCYFCEQKIIPDDKIDYMMNFDMVGRMRKLRKKLFVIGLHSSPQLQKAVEETPYKRKLRVCGKTHSGSDHAPFNNDRIPTISFTTGIHRDYHRPADVVSDINFDGMLRTLIYSQKIIQKLDNQYYLEYRKPGEMSLWNFIPMILP